MSDFALILLQAAIALPLAYGVVTLAWKNPAAIAALIAAYFSFEVIYDAFYHEQLPPILHVGPFAIFAWDAIFIALALVTALRFVVDSVVSRYQTIWLLLISLTTVSVVRGFAEFGVQHAGLEARPFFYFLVGAFYFSSSKNPEDLSFSIFRIWLWAALVICVVFCLQFLIGGRGEFNRHLANLGDAAAFIGLRSFNGSAAFLVAQAAIISLYLWIYKAGPKHWQMAGLIAFLPVTTFLLHRTVLASLVVMLIVISIAERHRSRNLAMLAAGYLLATFFGIVGLSFLDIPILQSFVSASIEPFESSSTILWRYGVWKSALSVIFSNNALIQMFGQPFGFGVFWALTTGQGIAHTHNLYISAFLFTGFTGLLVFVGSYWRLLSCLFAKCPVLGERAPTFRLLGVLLIGQMVFYLTYGVNPEQGILMGMAMGLAARKLAFMPRRRRNRMSQMSAIRTPQT